MWDQLDRKYVMCGNINIASCISYQTGKFVEIESEFPYIFVNMTKCAICDHVAVLDVQQKVFSGGIVFICFNDFPFEATQVVCLRFFDSEISCKLPTFLILT